MKPFIFSLHTLFQEQEDNRGETTPGMPTITGGSQEIGPKVHTETIEFAHFYLCWSYSVPPPVIESPLTTAAAGF